MLRNLLFEVKPFDAPTFSPVTAILGAVALLACWIPARRAARVDPMELLRQRIQNIESANQFAAPRVTALEGVRARGMIEGNLGGVRIHTVQQ